MITADAAKAKADTAKAQSEDVNAKAADARVALDAAKKALEDANALNARDAVSKGGDEYAPFKKEIDAVKNAIQLEDEANVKYTNAEEECVAA